MKIKIKSLVEILVANFVFLFGAFLLTRFLNLPSRWGNFPMYAFYYTILAIIILVVFKVIDKRKFGDYGVRKISLGDFKLAIYFILLLFPIAFIARLLDPGFDLWFAQQNGVLGLAGLFFIISYIPFNVAYEELFMRSLIQSKFSRAYGVMFALIFLSINFVIAHFYLTNNGLSHVLATVIAVFFGSLVLVALFEITKNVFVTFITHLIYNIIILVQIYLHATKQTVPEIIFWVIFGVLFLLTFKKTLPYLKTLKLRFEKIPLGDKIFIVVLTIALPVILILIKTI
jgi:membrane protease YdiL (CAAX protease family)